MAPQWHLPFLFACIHLTKASPCPSAPYSFPTNSFLPYRQKCPRFFPSEKGRLWCIHTATELRVGEREPRRKASSWALTQVGEEVTVVVCKHTTRHQERRQEARKKGLFGNIYGHSHSFLHPYKSNCFIENLRVKIQTSSARQLINLARIRVSAMIMLWSWKIHASCKVLSKDCHWRHASHKPTMNWLSIIRRL